LFCVIAACSFYPNKSRSNKAKHGIDFEEAKEFWNDTNALTLQVTVEPESRFLRIARIVKYGAQIWAIVYTMRGNNVRLISARRARKGEKQLYENR
jgi:uncharacterized DUF497 family protein